MKENSQKQNPILCVSFCCLPTAWGYSFRYSVFREKEWRQRNEKKQGKIKPMITQRLTHQCSQQVVFNSYKTGNSPNSHIRRWMHKKTAAYLCLRIPLRNKKEDSNVCNRTNDPQDNVEWKKSCKKKKNTVLFHLCKSLENANQSIVTQGSSPVAQC